MNNFTKHILLHNRFFFKFFSGTTEFKKIFKSKTGNVLGEKFERQKGKWKLAKIVRLKSAKDVLENFELKSAVQSTLPKSLQKAIAKMMNVAALTQALKQV
jgi:hypothetical protein